MDSEKLFVLRQEYERLTREWDQVSNENVQCAEYGLTLLAEKISLEQRNEELEILCENTRHELEIAKEALSKYQTVHKTSTKTDIEQVESLLSERANRESSLNSRISHLNNDLNKIRLELERVVDERNRMMNENNELLKSKEKRDSEVKALKKELREMKLSETSMLVHLSKLEEKNISLQKQVSALESSRVRTSSAYLCFQKNGYKKERIYPE